jgi:Tol biopolymer transport system component
MPSAKTTTEQENMIRQIKRTMESAVVLVVLSLLVMACGDEPGVTPTPEPPFKSPLETTSVSPLTTPARASGRILFHSDMNGAFDVYLVDPDGSNLQRLTDADDDDVEPAWSADASHIAFASKRDGNYEIYVMDADGSNQQRLTNDPATDWGPTWSGDGSQIAFASERNGQMQLFVMNADGSDPRPLDPADQTVGWAPDWSRTRDEIVFVSDRSGNSELYLLQLDTGAVAQLTFSEFPAERPSWSPEGDQIAYMAAKEQRGIIDPDEIYVISRLGGEPRQLTDNLVGDITPEWSPDGQYIAFSSSREDGWNLYVMPISGEKGGITKVTNNTSWNRGPSWGR